MTTADWYVPSLSGEIELPEGLFITMFDAKNHVNEGLSSEQIKKEYEQNAKAVGEYVLSLSPERLALHETIVAMSLNLKFSSEDDFVNKFNKIYQEAVLPKIKEKSNYFTSINRLRRRSIEESAKLYFAEPPSEGISNKEIFDYYNERFVKNLSRYQEKIEYLSKQAQINRPTRAERQELQSLQQIVDYMTSNKERLIVDLVVNKVNLQENKRIVETIISGKEGVFDSQYIEQFEKLSQHTADSRQSFLIVGGAASGKGSVTSAVKKEQTDSNDLLEINPDLYKKLLLPIKDVGDNIEFHGSLTHAESSLVFDSIAERWQRMAENGNAPNILMDVARAGNWQLSVLGTGGTFISANTPMLPALVALERSYKRGEQTGRFMPTKELLQGHKEQIALNKNAMQKGINYRFYNTNVKFGEPTPLVARFDASQAKMTINDMGVMWDYFSKSQLNPDARSAEDLSFATPQTTAKEIMDHAGFMNIDIKNGDDLCASIGKQNDNVVCTIKDITKLQQNMGENEAWDFLMGMKKNGAILDADEHVLAKVDELLAQNQENRSSEQKVNSHIDCEEYAELLDHLVNEGLRVGKTESAYIYDFANDPELKDKELTIYTNNLDAVANDGKSVNIYDPSKESKRQNLLIIDAKVYNTPQKRAKLIQKAHQSLLLTGKFEAEGIYMNERRKIVDDYIFNNTGKPEIQTAKPNPEAVRVVYKITDKSVKIPVQWGEYLIEKDGAIAIREKDMPQLKSSLASYKQDKNPAHLLQEDGKAKIDIYGTDPFFVEDNYSNIFSETKYREQCQKILEDGIKFTPKSLAKQDTIIAYQIKKDDQVVMPNGELLRTGDYICVPKSQVLELQKGIDKGEPIINVFSMKQETLSKSYNASQKPVGVRIKNERS